MRVRFFLWRHRDYHYGWIVRYIASPYPGDYAEIAPDDGGAHCYLYRGAVEGWEPLWTARAV